MGSLRIWVGVIIASTLIIFVTIVWFFQPQRSKSSEHSSPIEKVEIGIQDNTIAALVLVAKDLGYFNNQGLDVHLRKFPSGKLALNAMLNGEVDVSTAADIPIMSNSFLRDDYYVLSTIAYTNNGAWIVARKDHGIVDASDLKGKRIATQKASAVHFFLSMFLLHNHISEFNVEIIFKKAVDLPQSLASGEIDAFSMRNPFITEAKSALGDNAVELFCPGIYKTTFNLIAKKDFVKRRSGVLERLLRALFTAENFIKQNKAKAIEITAKKLGSGRKTEVVSDWENIIFELRLEQSLLLTLEDQARWAINNKLTENNKVPNYLDFIYLDGLATVKAEGVTVIR